MNLRVKDGCRDDNVVDDVGHDMRDDHTCQEVVDDMKFLPDHHFLQTQISRSELAT